MKAYRGKFVLGFVFCGDITSWLENSWRTTAFSTKPFSFWDNQPICRKVFHSTIRAASSGEHQDTDDVASTISLSSRRSTLKKVARLIPTIATADQLFLLLTDPSSAATPPPGIAPEKRKTILITGCNSGIGLDATLRFAAQGHRVLLACRTKEKAAYAIRQAMQQQPLMAAEEKDLLIPFECNLASLQSISSFVQKVASTVNDNKIDVVALNAGIARNVASKDVLRTTEGFELTVGTNHFGHFYLANLLLPLVSSTRHC